MTYWERRAVMREAFYKKEGQKALELLLKAYDEALDNIQTDIDRIVDSFSHAGSITRAEAMDLLNENLSFEYVEELREQLKGVKSPKIRWKMLNEINSLAYRGRIDVKARLQTNIKLEMQKLADYDMRLETKLYEETFKKSYTLAHFDTSRRLGFSSDVAVVPRERMYEVLSNKWSGDHYSSRVWRNTDILAEQLQEVLLEGLSSGKSYSRMSTQLTHLANEMNQVLDDGKFAASRLVHTEMSYIANMGELQSYKDLGLEKLKIVATLDSRTSKICQEKDGITVAVDKAVVNETIPPFHPFCRSTTVTLIEGLDLDAGLRRARNKDGKSILVDGDMTYKEFKAKHM